MNCFIACLMFAFQAYIYFFQTSLLISISNEFPSCSEDFFPWSFKIARFSHENFKKKEMKMQHFFWPLPRFKLKIKPVILKPERSFGFASLISFIWWQQGCLQFYSVGLFSFVGKTSSFCYCYLWLPNNRHGTETTSYRDQLWNPQLRLFPLSYCYFFSFVYHYIS